MRYQDITSFDCFFFFNDTATTEIYTLSLHDALPISPRPRGELAEEVAGKAVRIRREGPREVDAGDLPMAGCAVLAGRGGNEDAPPPPRLGTRRHARKGGNVTEAGAREIWEAEPAEGARPANGRA